MSSLLPTSTDFENPKPTVLAPTATGGDLMKKVRDDVARLLNHAVKQPNITLKTEFLEKTVPLLYRDVHQLSSQDHVDLWNAYNHLSTLLSPVTANSLEVDEELNSGRYGTNGQKKWGNLKFDLCGLLIWMFIFVFAVFCTQGYSILMGSNTDRLTALTTDYINIIDNITLAKKASSDGIGNGQAEPLLSILDKKKTLEAQLTLAVQRQCRLNDYLGVCKEDDTKELEGISDPRIIQSRTDAILQTGKAIILLLNSLVLPSLLGFLGAIAFLTRNTLNHLNDSTFTPSWGGRYIMRVLLGGLLGVIGPWLYTSGKVSEIGLGLSLFAFLLGYSVELAFSLFDQFINYARESIKIGTEQGKIASSIASVIADPAGKSAANAKSESTTPG
jgi:hypothetical protein